MTFESQYQGQTSQCPHCQNSVVLRGNAVAVAPVKSKTKVIAWIASLVAVALLAALGVVLWKSAKPEAVSKVAATNPPDTSDIQVQGDDAAKWEQILEASDIDGLMSLEKQLASSSDMANALKTASELVRGYDSVLSRMNGMSPHTKAVKQANKEMIAVFTAKKDKAAAIVSAVQKRDESATSALLKDSPVFQAEMQEKLRGVVGRIDEVLKAADHPLSSENRLKKVACLQRVNLIYLAKQEWASEKKKTDQDLPTLADLLPFLKNQAMPKCPADGTYNIGKVSEQPQCSSPIHQPKAN